MSSGPRSFNWLRPLSLVRKRGGGALPLVVFWNLWCIIYWKVRWCTLWQKLEFTDFWIPIDLNWIVHGGFDTSNWARIQLILIWQLINLSIEQYFDKVILNFWPYFSIIFQRNKNLVNLQPKNQSMRLPLDQRNLNNPRLRLINTLMTSVMLLLQSIWRLIRKRHMTFLQLKPVIWN